ncbi:MAG: efflux RND transporter periplasmic adaptor subunit [Polaromonas sp.]
MNFFGNKQNAIISVAACTLILGVTAFFASKSGAADDKKTPPVKAALTVTTVQPLQSNLLLKLPANGTVAAWQEAIIGSEANGLRLVDVKANVGDRVAKGQVLATFATEQVNAEVAQAQASFAEAQANALDAAGNADKARTLQASGALSEQQINQYTTADKTAKARLEAAKAMLVVQQVRLKQTGVVAPDSGVISSRSATVGAVVGSGTELFKMIRGGRLEWRAEVTSSEMAGIKPGTLASVTAASGAVVQGRVRMIAPTVDSVTRNALVYVDLPANANIKAGMYARGEFDLGASSVLSLPQQALVLRDGFAYAMRVEPGNKVSQVKLQTGRRAGDAVEIIKGAKAGEQYVASGAAFLADGDVVKVVAAQPQSAANPASASKASK